MRFIVIGTSGCGKTVFAQALARTISAPHIELDDLWWSANWTTREPDEFRDAVAKASEGARWVADGNYSIGRSVLWPRGTHVIWLNYSRLIVFSRVLRRTARRVVTAEPLWAGNRESLAKALFSKESILLWSFSTFAKNREKYGALRRDPTYAHLQWVEFTVPSEATRFLRHAHSAA